MEGTRLVTLFKSLQSQEERTEPTYIPDSRQLPTFEYTQLPPGCVLLLSPDLEGKSPGLAWRLQTVRLDQKPKFDALSYVQGSQDSLHFILVNSQTYYVHHNLHSALPYLTTRRKREMHQRPMWIDAICINQNDKKEVAEQVALMHQVYQGARRLWVWLGLCKAQAEIPKAILLLDKINCAGTILSESSSQRILNDEDNTASFVVKPKL
jgi:hypothetical protein